LKKLKCLTKKIKTLFLLGIQCFILDFKLRNFVISQLKKFKIKTRLNAFFMGVKIKRLSKIIGGTLVGSRAQSLSFL
jgi:hypothetical protein